GELTLLGVTKPVKLEVTHFHCGVHPINKKQVCGADLTGRIKRSDFGMTKFLPGIGDDVRLIIPVEAFKE
ncbi:MAG: YceI family protein, partial [Myxococcota bacterium]|nr:YceI family protein [Myxococcota bacterium]